jgi:endonuclease/exonuclease/phosphatase family metal-dependent hydrolase
MKNVILKVATFNVLHEDYTGWHKIKENKPCANISKYNEDEESTYNRSVVIMDIIRALNYDIVFLQEVGRMLKRMLRKIENKYFVTDLHNNSEQVTLVKKSKAKSIIIQYQDLRRMSSYICTLKSGKDVLLINGHLPYPEKLKNPYVKYINKLIKNHKYVIFGGDANVTNKKHLFPKLKSLVKHFDTDDYFTSYSRGECINDIYKIKHPDDRYEFVDHIYVRKFDIKQINIYNIFANGILIDKEQSFERMEPPYENKQYVKTNWPSDHAIVSAIIKIK